jgi:hypothetical protein
MRPLISLVTFTVFIISSLSVLSEPSQAEYDPSAVGRTISRIHFMINQQEHINAGRLERARQEFEFTGNSTELDALIQAEAQRNSGELCQALEIPTNLLQTLTQNCQLETSAGDCNLAKSRINGLHNEIKNRMVELHRNSAGVGETALELKSQLMSKISEAKNYSDGCYENLTVTQSPACLDTYESFFDSSLTNEIANVCTGNGFQQEIDTFNGLMAGNEDSSSPTALLNRAVDDYSSARAASANLASYLVEVDDLIRDLGINEPQPEATQTPMAVRAPASVTPNPNN